MENNNFVDNYCDFDENSSTENNSEIAISLTDSETTLTDSETTIITYSEKDEAAYETYYSNIERMTAKCRQCKKIIKKGGTHSTSGLRSHLLKSHKPSFDKLDSARKCRNEEKLKRDIKPIPLKCSSSIFDYCSSVDVTKWNIDNIRSKRVDEAILRFMCYNCMPLSLTEKPGFIDMMKELQPRYQVKGQ